MNTSEQTERIAEIESFLRSHFSLDPNEVAELRVLSQQGNYAIFFKDLTEMATTAVALDEDGAAVYYGLNPRHQSVVTNELGCPQKTGGKEQDITRRAWLCLDLDANRPNTKVCATNLEKEEAKGLLRKVTKWLSTQGMKTPRVIDSGNGYYILYKVDLPADSPYCEGVVQAVREQFDVKMDSVFDAPRILRLPGTMNRKGPDSPTTPHRRAKLATTLAPGLTSEPVLAAFAPKQDREAKTDYGKPDVDFEIDYFLGTRKDGLLRPMVRKRKACKWLSEQPPAIEGDGGDKQTFTVCCFLLRDFALAPEIARKLLLLYNQRCEPPWDESDLDRKLRDAQEKVLEEPDEIGRMVLASGEQKRASQFEKLVENAESETALWTTPNGESFATIDRGTWQEHWPVDSQYFGDWLAEHYRDITGNIAKEDSLQNAQKTLLRSCRATQEQHEAPVRVGYNAAENAVYVDLCDTQWRAVRITADGWQTVAKPKVRFRRNPAFLKELPEPQSGGHWDQLRPLVNVIDDEWPLYLAALLGFFLPKGTYPIVCITGPQDSGKTSITKLTQSLVDPRHDEASTGIPKMDDLLKLAEVGYLQAYNNASRITSTESDRLCTLVEGTCEVARTLYTNKDLTQTRAKKPVLINGIGLSSERGDVLTRTLQFNLEPREDRLGEQKFVEQCDKVRPLILGCLYDSIACALKNWQDVNIDNPPRLVDLAKWMVNSGSTPRQNWQCKQCGGGYFCRAYCCSRSDNGPSSTIRPSISPVLISLSDTIPADKVTHSEIVTNSQLCSISLNFRHPTMNILQT